MGFIFALPVKIAIFPAMNTVALIVAGGSGQRFGGDIPKQFELFAGKPLLAWTISRFEGASTIDSIVIVTPDDFLLYVNNQIVNQFEFKKVFKIVPGGESRTESVMKGLASLPISTGFVAIHDGVRPLIKPADIDLTVLEARNSRAAILGQAANDTIKRIRGGMIIATLERDNLFVAQTPQVFQYDLIMEAYKKGMEIGTSMTDDAAMVEAFGFKVKAVEATGLNPKLTTLADDQFIRYMLEREEEGGQ